jgi:hypothetical protein
MSTAHDRPSADPNPAQEGRRTALHPAEDTVVLVVDGAKRKAANNTHCKRKLCIPYAD